MFFPSTIVVAHSVVAAFYVPGFITSCISVHLHDSRDVGFFLFPIRLGGLQVEINEFVCNNPNLLQDTVAGFLLSGIGLRDGLGKTNYLIVDSKTKHAEIEAAFRSFVEKRDTGVVIINQHVADEIRHVVDSHKKIIPTILEIPSKDKQYDQDKDSVMQRVKVFFGGVLPDT
ncbi:putative vacuolar atp synthase subunit f [Cardiosporidium cionae]|uniref:Vacuolar atp synthase subunit f n=1 Tax=Cardiosporidium cionae TaxID=476202 RepID=A0ABQ7JC74_9APIC|nr:putative vacuolar atp synthase subunit f [Cardiosporidium cionae]|eukprot:KAF8821608.1 putative vacuolar atp synthase subunit f [Cardiosporidium cionae]